ncbi:hypothetical protein, partial [Pseudomonas sp. HY2-MNA-CIBAN-0224]
YSGWGLTDDSGAPKRLLKVVKKRRQAFAAAMLPPEKLTESGRLSKLLAKPWKIPERLPNQRNKQSSNSLTVTLESLFYSAYIDYSAYVD